MTLAEIVSLLNSLSPLALLGASIYIIYLQVKGKRDTDVQMNTISHNHLSGLPEMLETLQRMERTIAALDSFLRAKLGNGFKIV